MVDSSHRLVVWMKNFVKWIGKNSLNLIVISVLLPGYVIAVFLAVLGAIALEIFKQKSVRDNNYTAYRAAADLEKTSEETESSSLRTRALIWTLVFYVGLIWYNGLEKALDIIPYVYLGAVWGAVSLLVWVIDYIVTVLST